MPAIRVHHTDVDTESDWDGPAEVVAAPNEEATLRYMHAWRDADGKSDAKSTYKFPHHEAGADTPANIKGVNNGLARLSGSNIPDEDKDGVERHLRAHREDAGLENPEDEVKNASHREPIRCFEGGAQPYEPFWHWRDATDDDEAEMELYGFISEYSWWEDDVTPKKFKEDLYHYGAGGPITIRMNSGGGDVVAASVMRAIIMDYPGRVTMQIDGLAASAATVVAIAGDKIRIQDSAYFMIHDPSVMFFLAQLNIEELSRMAASLQSVKEGIMDAYKARTGLGRTVLSRMMTNETWMSAKEARNLGFVDEIIDLESERAWKDPEEIPTGVASENAAIVNALKNYRNVPAELTCLVQAQASKRLVRMSDSQGRGEDIAPEAARLRDEVKLLK